MSLANTRVCLIYPRQCPPTGEKKRYIFDLARDREVPARNIQLSNSRTIPPCPVRFISMYDLGNPATAILISFLLPLVNRSREKYACYSRLIRARIQKKEGKGRKSIRDGTKKKERGKGKKKKKNGSICEFDLVVRNDGVRGSCSTILRSRFVRFIVNDCPASRRCLLIHRRCL